MSEERPLGAEAPARRRGRAWERRPRRRWRRRDSCRRRRRRRRQGRRRSVQRRARRHHLRRARHRRRVPRHRRRARERARRRHHPGGRHLLHARHVFPQHHHRQQLQRLLDVLVAGSRHLEERGDHPAAPAERRARPQPQGRTPAHHPLPQHRRVRALRARRVRGLPDRQGGRLRDVVDRQRPVRLQGPAQERERQRSSRTAT